MRLRAALIPLGAALLIAVVAGGGVAVGNASAQPAAHRSAAIGRVVLPPSVLRGADPFSRSKRTTATPFSNVQSTSYAGYLAPAPSSTPTTVEVTFVVPKLTCPSNTTLDVIPGGLLGSFSDYIGAGVSLLCQAGNPSYQPVVFFNGPFSGLGLTIAPGNKVVASLSAGKSSSSGSIDDVTTGVTKKLSFGGFSATTAEVGVDSAYYVLNDGAQETAGVPPFATTGFSAATLDGSSIGSATPTGSDMVASSTLLISTTALTTSGTAFSTTFEHSAPPFWLLSSPVDTVVGQSRKVIVATIDDTASKPSSAYSTSIDWGDGSASTTGKVEQASFDGTVGTPCPLPQVFYPGTSCFDVLGQHNYQSAGYDETTITAARPGAQSESAYGSAGAFTPSTLPKPTLASLGLLTFQHKTKTGGEVVSGCTATVVNSANLSTILTAAHCMNGLVFGGQASGVTNLQFAPAHTGECWDNIKGSSPHQVDADQCQAPLLPKSSNPFGVWYANPSDIYLSSKYSATGSSTQPDDFAFIVLEPSFLSGDVQAVVGGFPITWDTSTSISGDPLEKQDWDVSSYAADDINFTKSLGFGPYVCAWDGASFAAPNGSRIGVSLGNACSFVNPLTGSEKAFNFPAPAACGKGVPPFGGSGSPFTNNLNTGNGTYSIGAVLSTGQVACSNTGARVDTLAGTKLGVDAKSVFGVAQQALPK